MSILKIKRSGVTGAPGSLAQGELAYSYLGGTLINGGDRLYVGTGTETAGAAANIEVIGGKYFTDKLDHTPGTLTANSAIITAANNAIDQILIDQIHIDGSTIAVNSNTVYAAANTDLIIRAGSLGEVVVESPVTFNTTTNFDGQLTASSLNVEDLTATRIVYAGTDGELVDDSGLAYTGTGAGATLTIAGTLDVNTEALLATAKIEDLTDNRIVIAGVGGEIEDDANFTFDGTAFNIGATGEFTVDVATGNTQVKGTIDVDGQATLASLNVEDLTDNRIVIVGTSGEIEDDSNFTFDGTTFKVGTATNDKFRVAVATGNVDTTGNVEADGTLGADGNFRIGASGASNFTVAAATGNTLVAGTVGITGNTSIGSVWGINSATGEITHTGTQNTTGQLNVDNLRLDSNTLSSTDTNGNVLLDPDGDGYVQVVGTNGLVIPVGNTSQQGPSVAGAIRFNSEINQFEGYSGVNWSSLGGVRSVDGLTFIVAESSPGASDDTLYFHVATSNTTNTNVATMDEVGLDILATTQSSNTTTGSITTAGGVGIALNLNVGGNTDIDGDLNVDGGDITTNLTSFNLLNTNATTVNAFGAATAINIGTGGEGGGLTTINHDLDVVGDLDIGAGNFTVDAATGHTETAGNMTIGGDLVVNGNTFTINVSTLEVEDALIRLASNNTTTDAVDIGVVGNYYDATANSAMITGIFRDATSNEWFLFDEYVDANIDDNIIDTTSPTFSKGVLNTDKVAFSNTTIQLSGDVVGEITVDHFGGGDGDSNTVYNIATTVQPNSVELGVDTFGDYVQSISANTATGVQVTGTGESAVVTVSGVIATHSGQLGVATFDALSAGAGSNRNFDVSAGGSVSINTIDGGTY